MASRLFGLKALREGTWFNSIYRAAWWFLLMLPVILFSNLLWAWLIRQFGVVPEEQFLVRLLADGTFQGPFLVAFFLFAAVLAPVAEELFFRAWLFPVLSSRLNWIAAAATSGLCFSLLHGHPSGFLPLMLLGFVLAWAYQHTADIRVPILMHSFFNANTFLILILAGGDGV